MSLAALKRTTRFDENPKCPSLDIGEKAGFLNSFPFEFPTAGIGDFKEPCIDIEDEYGQNEDVNPASVFSTPPVDIERIHLIIAPFWRS